MSTHRRAWQKRAGVVVALVVGALLAVPATPALAAPSVNNVSASPSAVEAGKTTTVRYSLGFSDDVVPVDITVSSNNGKLRCIDGCERRRVDAAGTLEATFQLANDATNGSATITVKAVEAQGVIRQDAEASTNVTMVAAPPPPPTTQAPQTVRSISGKVVNQAGDGVPNAYVLLKDSAGKQYETNANNDGNFRFTGTSERPIAPGRIDLGASANSVREVVSFTANAGQSVTGQRITLAIQASNSPTPTPTASESAVPTEDPFDDELADEVDEAPAESAAPPAQASNEDSGGFGNWLLVLLGGLFVAVGVGTIVLLWMKRKENDDAEVDGDEPAGAPAGAVPAARGSFAGADDQTRVVSRVGNTPDPTMVAGAGISNAPTMMHQPIVDDVPPDPYGAPPAPYGAAPGAGQAWSGGGYGDEPGGYGASGYGNAPSSGSGYGSNPSSGAGYGGRDYGAGSAGADYPPAGGAAGYGERYDEPTGRYTGDETRYPAPADPYATGLYQPEAGQGYGSSEPTGYGRGEPTGGYGQSEATGGYGQGAPAGGYGQAEQPGGYGQGGSAGGYGSTDRDYNRGEPTGSYGNGSGYGQSEPATGYGQGAPAGGYSPSTPAGGYGQGEPTGSYGRTEPVGGYGQSEPTGGYSQSEPTGGYGQTAEPTGGYPPQTGGYGQSAGGYGQTGGYDDPGRYGQGGYGGGYGGQEAPQQRSGYDGGYDQNSGGYGQEPPRQRGGYDNGYEQGGAYGSDPAQAGHGRPDGGPAERGRRLDWLDD
ncbi:carboxypeptidase regulatory-like domain-containing protein [Micromonospora gifhornensis]|uniref:carboxypeptidase regulatory-like domain-containing protein n=1 Tax=Micromonospora gifhornensis TaxID=84594 RepID=UPI00195446EB